MEMGMGMECKSRLKSLGIGDDEGGGPRGDSRRKGKNVTTESAYDARLVQNGQNSREW